MSLSCLLRPPLLRCFIISQAKKTVGSKQKSRMLCQGSSITSAFVPWEAMLHPRPAQVMNFFKMHSLSALSVTTQELRFHTWTQQSRIKIDWKAVAYVYNLCPNLRKQSIHSAGDRAPWREWAVTRSTGPVKVPYHPASAREDGGRLRTQLYLQTALINGHEFKMEIY